MRKLVRVSAPATCGWWILFAAIIALMLAACSSEAPSPPRRTPTLTSLPPPARATATRAPGATSPPTAAPTAAGSQWDVAGEDLQGVQLDFWHAWAWEAGEAIDLMVEDFNATNPYGIHVESVQMEGYGELDDSFRQALGEGDQPDLVVGYGDQIQRWDRGTHVMIDLTPYLEDAVWGFTPAEVADFLSPYWEQEVLNVQRLGLPAQASAQMVFYNRTWAQELGFEDPPDTPETFREQACAAAGYNRADEDPGNDGTGGWVIDTSSATMLGWIYAFGGEVQTPQGYQFTTPEVQEALRYVKALFDSGCAWLAENRYPNPEFASRKALFITSSSSGIPFQERAFEDAANGDDWVVLPFPGVDGQPVIDVFGPSFAMVQSSPEEQLATWLLLKWLLTPANQARWVEASGYYPARRSALDMLATYQRQHPQWAQSVDLLAYGRREPAHASWGRVRWALADAAEQVFRLGLTLDQIPALLEELDRTAAELHAQAP